MSGDTSNTGAALAAPLAAPHSAPLAVPLAERLVTPLVWLGGALSASLILLILALTAYSIFMRYVIARPPVWVDELIGYLLVALISLGVAEGYRRGNHISIDLLTENLSARLSRLRWIWSDLCVLLFAVVLGLSTWEAVEFARAFGAYSSGEIEIQSWIPQLPLLIGAILLGVFAVARLIGQLTQGAGK